MPIQLFPENIRRFVGELTIEKRDAPAHRRDPAPFEFVDPPFPAERSLQAFLEYSHDAGKGVEMCSTVFQKTAG